MDAHDFDALTRRLATGMNRRGFLRAAAGGVAAALMTRAGIATAQTGPCPGGASACNGVCCSACERCHPAGGPNRKCVSNCPDGLTCVLGECVCPDGKPLCGQGENGACCEDGAVCIQGSCVCPPRTSACHPYPSDGLERVACCNECERCGPPKGPGNPHIYGECQWICPPGLICDDTGCHCPAGYSMCPDSGCCDDGCQQCVNGVCEDQCQYGTCSEGQCRCPDGQPVCGNQCCEGAAMCVQGSCVCPPYTSACRSFPKGGLERVACCNECERCRAVKGAGNPHKAEEFECEWMCPQGTVCDETSCACPAGTAACGSGPQHTCCDTVCGHCQGGKCTSTCPKGTTCSNNQCWCPDGREVCGQGSGWECCGPGTECQNGNCQRSGPGELCPSKSHPNKPKELRLCAPCERCNTKRGECESLCGPSQTCDESGQCACVNGREACGDVCCGDCQACVNGACRICQSPAFCVEGECRCPGPNDGARPPLCGNTCCGAGQTCVNDICVCADGSTGCRGECCDAAACEACGPGGCETTCEGPCHVCDDGDCLEVVCADDGDICTQNVCIPAEGGCVALPIEYCCETDDDCPDDGNPCTRVVCDTAINRCDVQLVNEVECADGNPCTGPGQCGGGECIPGPSLCGPCEMCAESGCVEVVNGVECPEGGVCCDGDCLPACPLPQVMTDDCSCACPEVVTCDPGSEFDPSSCACCRSSCLPGECGEIPNGCGGETLQCTEGCCEPITCEEAGATCGLIDNGCGEQIFCGECEPPNTCGGGGVANQCGCTGMTCEEAGVACGWLEDDGCGNRRDCGPCGNACGACTPFGSSCVSDGECCSGFCDPVSGLCSYAAFDYVCFANGEPCPDPAQTEAMCCGTCVDGCCTCVGLWGSCDDSSQCCEGTCFGYPDPSICCRAPGEACTPETAAECCTGRCVDGVCDCAAFGDRCELGLVDCCEFPNSCLRNVCSPI